MLFGMNMAQNIGSQGQPVATQSSAMSFDIGVSDLDLDTLYLEDVISIGKNLHIIAKIMKYNENTGLFELDPVAVKVR